MKSIHWQLVGGVALLLGKCHNIYYRIPTPIPHWKHQPTSICVSQHSHEICSLTVGWSRMTVLYIVVPSIAEYKKRNCCLGIRLQCMHCCVFYHCLWWSYAKNAYFYHQWTNPKHVHVFSVTRQQFYMAPAVQQPNNVSQYTTWWMLKKGEDKSAIKGYSHSLRIIIVQELCESWGGRPGLSVLTSLLVSVDVKLYRTMLRHILSLSLICQPTSEDVKQHYLPTYIENHVRHEHSESALERRIVIHKSDQE